MAWTDNPAECTALVLYSADADEASSTPAVTSATRAAAGPAGEDARGTGSEEEKNEVPVAAPAAAATAAPRFVGLSNQGATCYMNSLLQTLYMTPEVSVWWAGFVARCRVAVRRGLFLVACGRSVSRGTNTGGRGYSENMRFFGQDSIQVSPHCPALLSRRLTVYSSSISNSVHDTIRAFAHDCYT